MRKPFSHSIFFAFCFVLWPWNVYGQGGRPIPPGVREADKQTNAPLEAPVAAKRKMADPMQLQKEAEELTNLSAGIPGQIALVNHGQIPKDLDEKLKRIEKLAKHLRSEISP